MSYQSQALPWFETGDFPTQEQFATIFNRLRWKDEYQGIGTITGLQNILNGLANPVEVFNIADPADQDKHLKIPAGFLLEKLIVQPPITVTVSLRDDDLAENVISDEEVLGGKSVVWDVNMHAITDRNITIATMPIGTILTIIKRKVTL